MDEPIIFLRRNRLKKHFVNTSNILLYGYKTVSDAAKITYQVIDGFDWENTATGDSKGFVFPAVQTLARIRSASARTIQRHIKELEKSLLLTRQRRRNKPSILFIEDVSEKETNHYITTFVEKTSVEQQPKASKKLRNDKNVVSRRTAETTKMSFAYMKEDEELKENKIVNEDKSKSGKGMEAIREVLAQHQLQKIGPPPKPKPKLEANEIAKRDYIAQEVAKKLNDEKSLGCYRVIAEKVPEQVVFEILASVKDTYHSGKVKRSRGALFVDIIKRYSNQHGINLGF